ncbi:MAG: PaaI family thioesterase [Eggerthellaceae bacterium]|nr:PaaI family thioesterase [Eggerthellaceae bacterium]
MNNMFENDEAFLAQARAYFDGDTFVFRTIGMEVIAAAPGHALVSMEAEPHIGNAKAGVHGGALFTLADIAVAVADFNPDEINMTVDASIQYLAPSKGSVLYAHAYAKKRGGTMGFYRVDIADDLDATVAVASFTYLHRPFRTAEG